MLHPDVVLRFAREKIERYQRETLTLRYWQAGQSFYQAPEEQKKLFEGRRYVNYSTYYRS